MQTQSNNGERLSTPEPALVHKPDRRPRDLPGLNRVLASTPVFIIIIFITMIILFYLSFFFLKRNKPKDQNHKARSELRQRDAPWPPPKPPPYYTLLVHYSARRRLRYAVGSLRRRHRRV